MGSLGGLSVYLVCGGDGNGASATANFLHIEKILMWTAGIQRAESNRLGGQQIQDTARMKHISKSKSPAKAPSALSSSLKCMVDNWTEETMSVTSQQSFLAILRVSFQKRSRVTAQEDNETTTQHWIKTISVS